MSKVWLTTGPLNFVTDKPDRIGSCGRKDKARPMKRHEVARIGALIRAASCDLVWIVLLAGSGTLVRAIDARPRGRLDLGFYFSRAPFGTSSVNVARTGFPSSPTDAARSMP